MKYDEQKAIGEGYRNLKHYLRKLVFEDFKVTVDDQQTLEHYFMTHNRQEMLHRLVESNLSAYSNLMFNLRRQNYPQSYGESLTELKDNLRTTIEFLDDLIKEAKK